MFSSGLISASGRGRGPAAAPGASAQASPPPPPPLDPAWEQQHLSELDNATTRKGLKLFWFATAEDRLMPTTRSTVELLKQHGFTPVFKESPRGHTWANWREYLNEFAPQLFSKSQYYLHD